MNIYHSGLTCLLLITDKLHLRNSQCSEIIYQFQTSRFGKFNRHMQDLVIHIIIFKKAKLCWNQLTTPKDFKIVSTVSKTHREILRHKFIFFNDYKIAMNLHGIPKRMPSSLSPQLIPDVVGIGYMNCGSPWNAVFPKTIYFPQIHGIPSSKIVPHIF